MPSALKKPTLDGLYRRLRDLDYTQVDERMAVMLNAILQLEEQGECRESATEAVLMVGYTTDGVSNQEQTRWLSWNVDGARRGFDLARNPGLNNNTEYGAGEFPLPVRPSVRSTSQSTSKLPSMTRAQQTGEAYPDGSIMKRELERTQRERNKANLDRDQAVLERDQAKLERDQARRELDMMRAEQLQAERVRENVANCEQLKAVLERDQAKLERIQRQQRELDMRKGARPKERVVTGSRPESRMEVDEAHRSKGRFNLDRAAQEHMNEGLEVWIPSESASSLRGLETQVIRPLMDVALPEYTPSSTPGSSQVSGSSSRLKELHERLQLRSRESPARVDLPSTWGEQPVKSVVISSYKKNTEGRYRKHNRMVWNAAQRERRDCFHDATWVEYLAQPRMPEGVVHLIIGDSLLRVLTRIQSHWQTGILSFAGAATPQMLATLEMLGMVNAHTVTLMIGTNDVSRGEARKVTRLHDKMSCILEELRIQMDPAILTVCTVRYNMGADQHAVEMNTKVRGLNEIIRKIHRRSVLPLGLLDVAEQMELSTFPDDASADGIHFDRPRGVERLNNVFQRHICALEAELLETAQVTFGLPPNPPFFNPRALSCRLGDRADSRDLSRNSRTKLPSAAPMEADEATSSTPQGSIISSVVLTEKKKSERPAEISRLKYEEKVKELDLEDLECTLELANTLGLEQVSHEDLGRHQCVDWLKAHETHFSRAKLMETEDLTGITTKSVMGRLTTDLSSHWGARDSWWSLPNTEPALPGLEWPLQHS